MKDSVLNRREMKKKARSALKLNYFACIAVCFIMVFLAGEYSTTVQGISMWDMTHVADLKYSPEQKKEIVQDMVANGLTAEETDKKWHINNVDAVKKWKKTFEDFGLEGLNSKEVTFFGTTGDGSTINTLLGAFSITKSAKERLELSASVKGSTIGEILPVFDNFERALAAETEDTNYKAGVEMIFKQFGDMLTKLGVEIIDPIGQTFDPNIANAVNQIEDENLGENEVAQVFQKGYKIGDKVIRYAMVVVANP